MSLLRDSPIEAGVSLFRLSAHCINIFTIPESRHTTAAVLTSPKLDLQGYFQIGILINVDVTVDFDR